MKLIELHIESTAVYYITHHSCILYYTPTSTELRVRIISVLPRYLDIRCCRAQVFVGNETASNTRSILAANHITHIVSDLPFCTPWAFRIYLPTQVNCAEDLQNAFEDAAEAPSETSIEYFRCM